MTGSSNSAVALENMKSAFQVLRTDAKSVVDQSRVWLGAERDRNFSLFNEFGLPTKKLERWKYTSLNSFNGVALPTIPQTHLPRPATLLANGQDLEGKVELVFINGRFSSEFSKLRSVEGASVSAASLSTGDSEFENEFKTTLNTVQTAERSMEALNSAFFLDAAIISISRNIQVTNPIVLRFVQSDSGDSSLEFVCPRVFVSLEEGAQAEIIEIYEGANESQIAINAVTDIRLSRGARLHHLRIQNQSLAATHIGATRVVQDKDSTLMTTQLSFGSSLSRENIFVSLKGQGAHVTLNGLSAVSGRQHADAASFVHHEAANTSSAQIYKNVLAGESRGVFNGFVHIARDAQQSNASQLNKNLLLSAKAEIDTKPELEIDADDVKASHGATIAQIDPEHIFYLQTRGIGRDQAVQMLSSGFARDIAFRIQSAQLKEAALAAIEKNFSKVFA